MMRVLVTGGSRGLGAAVIRALKSGQYDGGPTAHPLFQAINWDRKGNLGDGTAWQGVDLTDEREVIRASRVLFQEHGIPHVIVNCAGTNEIGWLEQTDQADWDRVIDTNAKTLFLMAKTFLPSMESENDGGVIINITSNAAWTPMTGSIAYNASKAAAHMVTRQLAHEVTRRGMKSTVFGIAPGKIAGTEMSSYIERRVVELRGWEPEFAKEYQLKGLPTMEELPVEVLADFICLLLTERGRHRYFHGCIIPIGTWMGM